MKSRRTLLGQYVPAQRITVEQHLRTGCGQKAAQHVSHHVRQNTGRWSRTTLSRLGFHCVSWTYASIPLRAAGGPGLSQRYQLTGKRVEGGFGGRGGNLIPRTRPRLLLRPKTMTRKPLPYRRQYSGSCWRQRLVDGAVLRRASSRGPAGRPWPSVVSGRSGCRHADDTAGAVEVTVSDHHRRQDEELPPHHFPAGASGGGPPSTVAEAA